MKGNKMTELEKAIQAYCQEHNDDCFEAIGDECPFIGKAFKAGAKWMKEWIINNAALLNSRILPTNIEENEFCLDDFDEDEVDVITKAVKDDKFKCGDKVKLIIMED